MGFSVSSIIWVTMDLMEITMQRTRPAWHAKTKLRLTLNCSRMRSQAANLETQKQTKWIEMHQSQLSIFFLRRPLRWLTEQKNPARYNEFGYNAFYYMYHNSSYNWGEGGGGGLFNLAKRMVLVLHKELECKVEKLKCKKLEVMQPRLICLSDLVWKWE